MDLNLENEEETEQEIDRRAATLIQFSSERKNLPQHDPKNNLFCIFIRLKHDIVQWMKAALKIELNLDDVKVKVNEKLKKNN